MKPIIAPSFLSADFGNLQRDAELINNSRADWFHLDIMDGHFVPNLSFGIPVVAALKKHAKKPLDVHLMISNPDQYIEAFYKAGADILTVHYEACTHLHRTVQNIKELGMQAGVSLNPHTPVEVLQDILPEIDLVLIMSVNPGFGGQKFIPQALNKIERLRAMADDKNPECIIQVDGGVDKHTAPKVLAAGARALVAGSYIFKSDDIQATIESLKALGTK
ncbi:MAG: ribulose-phosphate 3-epimerase [Bacteroidota bacterium]